MARYKIRMVKSLDRDHNADLDLNFSGNYCNILDSWMCFEYSVGSSSYI